MFECTNFESNHLEFGFQVGLRFVLGPLPQSVYNLDHIVDLLPLTLGGDFLETLQCSDELLFVLISDSAFHSLFHPVDDLLDFIYEVEAANSFLKALLRVELLSGRELEVHVVGRGLGFMGGVQTADVQHPRKGF